ELSNDWLGHLQVAEVSPGLKWLALSGRSRGGVWNLSKGENVLALRDFRGGHLSDEGYFFADFSKTEDVPRNIGRFNLNNGEAFAGPKIEIGSSYQFGQYLFTIKSAKAEATEDHEPTSFDPSLYLSNFMLELMDSRTMKTLWSLPFPKGAPKVW